MSKDNAQSQDFACPKLKQYCQSVRPIGSSSQLETRLVVVEHLSLGRIIFLGRRSIIALSYSRSICIDQTIACMGRPKRDPRFGQ